MFLSLLRSAAVSVLLLLGTGSRCRATGFAMKHGPGRPRSYAASPLPTTKAAASSPFTACTTTSSSSSLSMALSVPSGGAIPAAVSDVVTKATSSPAMLFDSVLVLLASFAAAVKVGEKMSSAAAASSAVTKSDAAETKPAEVKSLQLKFLSAFWLLRCGYWMSGPYVVPAYASKVIGGTQLSMAVVSKIFLTGFAATAIFGPSVGQATDKYGRMKGTLAFAILYSIGVGSIKSNSLPVLFAGRAVVGVALSLLFSAPEAWVNGAASEIKGAGKYLGETFGLAYLGDSLVAIIAGKLASIAAASRGPTGPFDLSIVFLAAGAAVAGLFWKENSARATQEELDSGTGGGSIREAFDVVRADPKIMLVGAVQSLFEAAMYVFILQWPPAISNAVNGAFGADAMTPYGTVFSCFMTCSLLGSILFGKLIKSRFLTETTTSAMLAVSAASMGLATFAASMSTIPITAIVCAFLAFEACVGMYFPAMGTLRSKYVPDSHKSVILNLFGIPLNTLVVVIYLAIKQLGTKGALGVSSGALAVATGCMMKLRSIAKREVDA